jgi:hypothetical protein
MALGVSENVMSEVRGLEAQHSNAVVLLLSADGDLLYMSKQQLMPKDGYQPEQKVGRSFQEFLHPDDVETAFRAMQVALIADKAPDMRLRVMKPNGGFMEVNATTRRLIDEASGEFYIVHVGTRAEPAA